MNLYKIISSTEFNSKLANSIQGTFGGYIGKLLVIKELEAEMIRTIDIYAKNGFFQYLQSQLIVTNQIVANSGDFINLKASVALIDNLLAGTVSAETGQLIHLTAQNVVISDAVIRDLIASRITVAMLKAGAISTDSFSIESDDGGLAIVGNTMQFYDAEENVRIQIGRDNNNNFAFTLYDATGKVTYLVHMRGNGNGKKVCDGMMAGSTGQNRFEALYIWPVKQMHVNGSFL